MGRRDRRLRSSGRWTRIAARRYDRSAKRTTHRNPPPITKEISNTDRSI